MSSYNNPENLAHVKSIAEQIEAIYNGDIYRDEEGTDWNCEDGDRYQSEDDARDIWEYDEARDIWERTNGETSEDDPRDEWEQVSMFDYFSDALDIEYRVSSPHDTEPRSVCIMVACGGPNIYVDTRSQAVELYWWGDRASYPISHDAASEIDAAFAELWNC
jgi:hypothetical protein